MNEQRLDDLIHGKDMYRGLFGRWSLRLKPAELVAFEDAKQRGYLIAATRQHALRNAWELWCEIHPAPYAVVCLKGSKSKVSFDCGYWQRVGNAGNLTEAGEALLLDLLKQYKANWSCSNGHAEIFPVANESAELLMRQMLAIHRQHHQPAWDGKPTWHEIDEEG